MFLCLFLLKRPQKAVERSRSASAVYCTKRFGIRIEIEKSLAQNFIAQLKSRFD